MKSPPQKIGLRCCVATRDFLTRGELLRVVRTPARKVYWDPTGKAPGRGAYVCPTLDCIDRAEKRRALERALRVSVPAAVYAELRSQVKQ
ncbi:RNase P modulator RnpM [Pasteuria penetrans]|uniref:RNase P modulator RnpM n=1 Tax=Pasteuria penetrans TaxID=86005 RepID=UPI000FAE5805|nr:YlxR family protein [Pasteuria penetrans]